MSVENVYELKIFVKHFSIRDDTDPDKIIIDIHFDDEIFPVESSGIDFSDFSKGVCITQIETAGNLISKLKNRPLKLFLKKFLTEQEVGLVEIPWPDLFLTKLKDTNFKHCYDINPLLIKNLEGEIGEISIYLGVKNKGVPDTEIPTYNSLTSYKSIEKYDSEVIMYSLENVLKSNLEVENERYIVDNGKLYKSSDSLSNPRKSPTIKERPLKSHIKLSTIKESPELSRVDLPYKCTCYPNPTSQSHTRSQRPQLLQRPSSLNINPEILMRKWCNTLNEESHIRPTTVGCLSDVKEEKKSKIKIVKKSQENKISKTQLEKVFKLKKICVEKLRRLEDKGPKLPKSLNLCSKQKKNSKRKYSYKFGKKHPGVVLGHSNCVGNGGGPVPHNMGWLWNVQIPGLEKIRKGWRPGAVKKPIKELMCYFLEPCPCDTLPVTKKLLKKRFPFKECTEKLNTKPTLRIQRKDGHLFVTMNPIKNLADLKNCPDPYLNCKPIQFKISPDPNSLKRNQIKKKLKKCGFRRCVCDKTIAQCICMNYDEKFDINENLNIFSAAYNAEHFMKAHNQPSNIDSTEINHLKILFERSKCDSSAVRKLKSVLMKGKLGVFIKEIIGERKLNELLLQNKFNEIFASVNLNELTDCGKPNKFGHEIKLNDPTTTDESELDIEFTPPVGFIKSGLKKKKYDRVVQETQYDEKDFQLPKIPKVNVINDGKKVVKNKSNKGEKSGASYKKAPDGKKIKTKLENVDEQTEQKQIGGKNTKNPKISSRNNPTDQKLNSGTKTETSTIAGSSRKTK